MTNEEIPQAVTDRAAALDMLVGFAEGVGNSDGPLNMIGALRLVELAVDQARRAVVAEARSSHTWEEIGDALGTTRQNAQQRFGR